jgi:hypothetical protein
VVFELRDTFDWLLRTLFPSETSKPGAMYHKLMEELIDERTGKLKGFAKDKYNELSLQFRVGQYEPSSLTGLRGGYQMLNEDMHRSNQVDIPDLTGISCGGKSRQQQHKHAFIVAIIQMLCAGKGRMLDPALQRVAVLKTDFNGVEGTVAGGRFTPLPPQTVKEAD